MGEHALEWWKIDDPLSAIPVHGACGAWGVIAPALFDLDHGLLVNFFGNNDINGSDVDGNASSASLIGTQILGLLCIGGWSSIWALCVFGALQYSSTLRADPALERRGLNAEFLQEDVIQSWKKEFMDEVLAVMLD